MVQISQMRNFFLQKPPGTENLLATTLQQIHTEKQKQNYESEYTPYLYGDTSFADREIHGRFASNKFRYLHLVVFTHQFHCDFATDIATC